MQILVVNVFRSLFELSKIVSDFKVYIFKSGLIMFVIFGLLYVFFFVVKLFCKGIDGVVLLMVFCSNIDCL